MHNKTHPTDGHIVNFHVLNWTLTEIHLDVLRLK
jgi:hypothetical protein